MNWRDHIVSDPEVLLGKPTIKGTRLSIEFLLERLAGGWTEEMLLENAPRLTRPDLQAVRVLRRNGLDVNSVGEDSPSIKDWEVMDNAITSNRTILTHDRDYGELVFKHDYRPSAGVIYFRMKDYLPEEPAQILLQLLSNPNFVFEGLHTVIDNDGSIRQRPIPAT